MARDLRETDESSGKACEDGGEERWDWRAGEGFGGCGWRGGFAQVRRWRRKEEEGVDGVEGDEEGGES